MCQKIRSLTLPDKLLRSCEQMLSKNIAINGTCTNDLERLAFIVLVAEKEVLTQGNCTKCNRGMTKEECGDVLPEELVCDTCAGLK